MVSSFASQLQAIANKSSSELDLKARRNAHAESLLFDKDVAVKQDFDTIYNICIEGFRELCLLDSRFHDFDQNLFAEQAKSQDREDLSKSQNEALDLVLKRCLMLLGGKILLKPALKALEWMIRRFRVHVYNVDDLLHTLLPYHETSVWANALSIVPTDKIVGQWKFARPYLNATWNVPRHAIAHAAAHNDAFFASMNSYAIDACRQSLANFIHLKFWSAMVVEAISTRLACTKSGRKEVQAQRVQDLLLKVLPLLSEGFGIQGSPDLIITCYTITIILAAKAELADHVLDSLLLAVTHAFQKSYQDPLATLTTLSVAVSHKNTPGLPKRVLDMLSNLENFSDIVQQICKENSCQQLLSAAVKTSMSLIKPKNARRLARLTLTSIHLTQRHYPDSVVDTTLMPFASKLSELTQTSGIMVCVRNELLSVIREIKSNLVLSTALLEALNRVGLDTGTLESLLGTTIDPPESAVQLQDQDPSMEGVPVAVESSMELIPSSLPHQPSFLADGMSDSFHQISSVFEACSTNSAELQKFTGLPLWSVSSNQMLLWQTFLMRFACGSYASHARQKALHLLAESFRSEPGRDSQFFIPYALMLLTDIKAIRQSASSLLYIIQDVSSNDMREDTGQNIYSHEAMQYISPLTKKQTASLLLDIICPVLEECILDPTHIVTVIQTTLQPRTTQGTKKSHRQALFTLLTQHALATPLVRLKVTVISMLGRVQKVGGKSKTGVLSPILQEWSRRPVEATAVLAQESGLSIESIDSSLIQLADMHDTRYLEDFARAADSSDAPIRPGLVRALFDNIRKNRGSWAANEGISLAETLFNICFAGNELWSGGARDILQSVDMSSEALATILHLSETGSSDIKGPPSKKRRRSSSTSQPRVEVAKAIEETTAKISFALELVDNNHPESKPELVTDMFEMLACLRRLQQNRIESPYLINLCLSSIYAMVRHLTANGKVVDVSGIKPELVTECLRNSDNPQVQNTSVLVLAALSTAVPDHMVHNVMPIFTFIGHKMVSKDDEHSMNVVNEAIDKIVPALLQSLRKGSNIHAYQASMSTMLANFTSAYEHIPRLRRAALYQRLLFSIDVEDCGFVLIALLAAQKGKTESFGKFLDDLSSALSTSSRLLIYRQLIELSVDVLSKAPKTSLVVYNLGRATSADERISYAASSLRAAIAILQNVKLASGTTKRFQLESKQTEHGKELLRVSFETAVNAIRELQDVNDDVVVLAKQSLDALLQLPNLFDLLKMLESSLDQMEATQLRPQALRILSLQLQGKAKKDGPTRDLALSLLDKLNDYIDPDQPVPLVQASLACVNRIDEMYGRKSPDVIVSVVKNITKHGLNAFGFHQKMLEGVILTIASIVEVAREGVIPFASDIISQVLSVFPVSAEGVNSPSLFGALCTLWSALFSNVAFVISQEQVTQILNAVLVGNKESTLRESSDDLALSLETMAKSVDLEILIRASMAVLKMQTKLEGDITATVLNMVGHALETSSKTTVAKQAEALSRLFQFVLETEAAIKTQRSSDETTANLSRKIKDVSIKFIYKINDTVFRPIFESWIDWATSPDSTAGTGHPVMSEQRQIALFELLVHFFDTLKAIVTSYATYLLAPISSILRSATSAASTKPNDQLLASALTLLRTVTIHDQDSFFSAPSHFDPIVEPLASTLRLAASKGRRPLVSAYSIPAMVALATATMDSPTTHGTLAHHLVGFKTHSSPHVRLASIQTLLALTRDEDVGDDFIANTIGIGVGEGEGARGGGGGVGEIMVYVNEMLEDDDDDVETEVRRWVQIVREKVGEDVFEI